MNLFKRLSGLIESFTTIAMPRPAYATTTLRPPAPERDPSIYFPPERTQNKPYSNRVGLSEFRSLSSKDQADIQDFITFRYRERISNPRFRSASIYNIKSDLARKLQVPVGNSHKYLSRELIDRLID